MIDEIFESKKLIKSNKSIFISYGRPCTIKKERIKKEPIEIERFYGKIQRPFKKSSFINLPDYSINTHL